jgi:hypothetical protein
MPDLAEPIAPDRSIRDVVRQYPTTGDIFLQHGRMFRTLPGQLYPVYDPPLTVAEYAALNGVGLEELLRLLNAAAEAERFQRRMTRRGPTARS